MDVSLTYPPHMATKERTTHRTYAMHELSALTRKPEMAKIAVDLKTFIGQNSPLLSVLNTAASFFFIIDFSKMEYVYVSDSIVNVMGYTAEEWKREGMNAAFRTLHPEDRDRLKKVHEDQFAFHFSKPAATRKDYRYSTDFRVYRKDQTLIWIMTQDSFIALDDHGRPSLAFEICTEVTHIKRDNTMTLSISKCGKDGSIKSEKKYYYPLERNGTFSRRELEVLRLLYQGLSSKEIGAKLSISELTVFKHRRNMIRKAGVSNTHALINHAVKNDLI